MSNIYWELFYKSGKIEQYLKYRGHTELAKGNGYVASKKQESEKSKSGSN